MEGVVNNKEAELTKMQEAISKIETSKLELEKKHEEILQQNNVGFSLHVLYAISGEDYLVRNYHTFINLLS